jgi:3D (Asp-Asp-Asp) domain-containing protein
LRIALALLMGIQAFELHTAGWTSPTPLLQTPGIQIEKRGSQRLSKGRFIILEQRKNKPLRVMVGKGTEKDAVWLPEVTRAYKTLTVTATAYDPGPEANGTANVGATVTGERARFGIAAVDPKVIPLKALLYVEGYGPALAADVGGDIKGRRIDLCFNSTREANAFGRKKARVYLLSGLKKAERDKVLEALKN